MRFNLADGAGIELAQWAVAEGFVMPGLTRHPGVAGGLDPGSESGVTEREWGGRARVGWQG